MQIHITIDGAAAEQMFNQIALKHSVTLAAAVQAAQPRDLVREAVTDPIPGADKTAAEVAAADKPADDPLPPSDKVGAEKLAEPEKPKAKVGRAQKEKAPEKPAEINDVACREALKKVAAKAGAGDATAGVGKVEQLLEQFSARKISDLKPDQWAGFHEACMAYVNAE